MSRSDLLVEHRSLARIIAREFFIPGADRQDVEQEALIGLWVAARDFRPDRGMLFRSFANMVIRRRLSTRVRLALAHQHRPLNESVRVLEGEDGDADDALDFIPGGRDPLEVLIERERLAAVMEAFGSLTDLEREALLRFANNEHGDRGHDKRTDNARQRARAKLRAAA